jgi:pimeloyl-ACP methyl ester carboxylesterase
VQNEEAPATHRVPVDGGELGVHDLSPAAGPEAPVVVALHGITANALSWAVVARALGGRARVLAPDLRGRACSRDLPPSAGLGTHADDVLSLLDHLGLQRAVVVGHSMGAFVAALLAARRPDRVAGAVLVDGGVGFPAPDGADIDAVLEAVIGPAMRRLSMRWPSPSEHLAFWRQHPALGPLFGTPGEADLVAYLGHDLVSGSDGWRSSCGLDSVRADGADVVAGTEVLSAVRSSDVPTWLLWAPRGLLDEPQGLYDEQRLSAADLPDRVRVSRLADVNHYTVLLADHGAAAVAEAVTSALP